MRTDNLLQHANSLQNSLQFKTAMVVVIACLLSSTGCSRLGSNNSLANRRIPYPPQSLRSDQPAAAAASSAIAAADASARDAGSSTRSENFAIAPEKRTESNPARDQVQDLKSRPPKLAELPTTTLYAEPVIDNASQVAFAQEVREFNPSAEPPAQIFSQPLKKFEPKFGVRPSANNDFAMPKQREPLRNFVVADPQGDSSSEVTTLGTISTISNSGVRNRESGRIMRLTNSSSSNASEPIVEKAEASKLEIIEVVETKIEPMVEPKDFVQEISPLLPANLVATPEPVRPQVKNFPTIDASLAREVYHQSNAFEAPVAVKEPMVIEQMPEIVEMANPVAKTDLMALAERQFPQVKDFQTKIVPRESSPAMFGPENLEPTENVVASNSLLAGIVIDPTLEQQRKSRLDYPKRKIAPVKPEPEFARPEFETMPMPLPKTVSAPQPVVASKKIVSAFTPARIAEPKVVSAFPRVASIKQPDFLLAPLKPDFVPLKKCITCDNLDCRGCEVPAEDQFSAAIPKIHGGRSLAPMAVEFPVTDQEMARKKFGQVSFTPDGLPLPAAIIDSADDMATALAKQPNEDVQIYSTPGESDVPPVGVDAVMKINAVTWRSRLQQTIGLVQEQLNGDIDSETRTSLEINLRLLDVLSRQMGDIAQEQRQFGESENRFWQHQLEAITSMLKTSELTDVRDHDLLQHHTAHETLGHLRRAVAHLESLANLKIVSGAFCTEVSGYGKFRQFPSAVFNAGQKVLVYCEVENFTSEESPHESGTSFHTRLRGSYAIYDSAGYAVQQAEFPVLEDVARRRRRDFYMHLPITIGDLPPGDYELHLLVEDLEGNKTASLTPPLNLSVASKAPQALQARALEGSFTR